MLGARQLVLDSYCLSSYVLDTISRFDNFEAWEKIGSDRPYHYLGSTITFSKIGRAFGETMLELRKGK